MNKLNIKTEEERNILLGHLITLEESIYTKGGLEKTLKTIPLPYQKAINELLKGNMGKEKEIIERLKNELKTIQVHNLTLSYSPTNSQISKIHAFLKKNIEEDVILKINVDENIIGGAIITFKGKYKDLSLRKEFDLKFDESKKDIRRFLNI